ncbi:MAG: NADH-quinone oxidoreductase subunit L [Gammaproteobacteria bacterium]|nr:NADH-quinone oxidoreductase subunit L [Gammaproteobacteria bacterium]
MSLLFLTIAFPLLGFLLLAFSRGRLAENHAAIIGVGSIGLSALVTAWVGFDLLSQSQQQFTQPLWNWVRIDNFTPQLALHLDGLSLTLLGVVTGVGFLIHLFASWYMRGEEGYSRFFAYMNLFIASMLVLILADNLIFLYFGWEGVGLCSYLLIGFYYRNAANGAAAMKAFVITRIGDVFMAIGLFMLWYQLGTLNIQEILTRAPTVYSPDSLLIMLTALMLLGGAIGKSAQAPLHTWLADAMAGPTPVSALIHAATMVTAGVYLIARLHTIFELSPTVLSLIGYIGAITLLLAGFAALAQRDIKRILAYSTMSQIGYMFLALGASAWGAAIFHLMTHAFFKALLFLSAGAVIVACHHEQNIFKMGGLRKKLPLVYACFIVAGAALAALPFITAGFYSKDEILWQAFANQHLDLFIAGLIGALLTSIYTFRLIFIVFHGEAKTDAHPGHGIAYTLPLITLLVLSTFVGALIHPPLAAVLPSFDDNNNHLKHTIEIISAAVAILGIGIAIALYLGNRDFITRIANSTIGRGLTHVWYNAWGFDALYDALLVKPYIAVARLLRRDIADRTINLIPKLVKRSNMLLSVTQTGYLRWYTASIGIGAVIVLITLVFLN